jgi:hypothetical protein
MKKLVNGKNVNISDDIIKKYMKTLELTEEEAIQTYLEEEGYLENEEVEEMTKKAKTNKTDKIVVQSKVEKKKTERKPTENLLKQAIIEDIYKFLAQNGTLYNVKVVNKTKTIDFYAENKYFSLNLVEHRPKKDKN